MGKLYELTEDPWSSEISIYFFKPFPDVLYLTFSTQLFSTVGRFQYNKKKKKNTLNTNKTGTMFYGSQLFDQSGSTAVVYSVHNETQWFS